MGTHSLPSLAAIVLCSPLVWKPSLDYFLPGDSPRRMFQRLPAASVLSGDLPAASSHGDSFSLMVGRTRDEGLLSTATLWQNEESWKILT